MEIAQIEGSRRVRRTIDVYHLDMILSVGYRVNSKNATQFRIWANKILKEYLVKGRLSTHYEINSEAVDCLAMRKISHSRAPSDKYIKPLMVMNYIRVLKKKQLCYFIWLQKITLSAMETNALQRFYFCGS